MNSWKSSTMLRARRSRVAAMAFLVGLGAAASVSAGVNQFTPLGPEGGHAYALTYHPTDESIAYVAIASGFYRSADGGNTWQVVEDAVDFVYGDIAVHDSHPSRVFVGSRQGIYASNDEGETLTKLESLPTVGPEVEFVNGVLYVASLDRVYRSEDFGATFEEGEPIDSNIAKLRVDPRDPDVVYVLTTTGTAYRSADGGQNWDEFALTSGTANPEDLLITYDDTDTERKWVSSLQGVWLSVNDGVFTQEAAGTFGPLFADPTDPESIFAGNYQNGLNRIVAGDSVTIVHGDAQVNYVHSFTMDPFNHGTWLMGGEAGIVRSVDGGSTWLQSHAGIYGERVETLAPSGSDGIYAGSRSSGVYFIDGENLSVTPLNNVELRAQQDSYPFELQLGGLHVQPGEPDRLYAVLSDRAAYSADGGASWEQLPNDDNLHAGSVRMIVTASEEGDQVLLAAGPDGLKRSKDGGQDWVADATGLDGFPSLSAVAVAPSNPSVVYMHAAFGGNDNRIMKSEDGGASWVSTGFANGTNSMAIAVDPQNDQVVYVGTHEGLYKSTNGGQTWTTVTWNTTVDDAEAIAIDPQNSNILYVGNGRSVGRSVDGGATWQLLTPTGADGETEVYWQINSMLVDPWRPHRLFVAIAERSLREIRFEPDLAIGLIVPRFSAARGTPVTLTYRISNEGPFDASGVGATIELGSGASDVTAEVDGGSCSEASGTVTCTLPFLKADQSRDIAVAFTMAESGSYEITASVAGEQPDPVANNDSTASELEVVDHADLSIVIDGTTETTAGSAASYTVFVTNDGPDTARAVIVDFELASGLTVASATPSVGTCEIDDETATCTIEELAEGETAEIEFVTGDLPLGLYQQVVSVTSGTLDMVADNNDASITTSVTQATNPPSNPPTNPPSNPPSTPPRSGGGGGGSSSLLLLGLLGLLGFARRVMAR